METFYVEIEKVTKNKEFKSYYVVWKLFWKNENNSPQSFSLNRTM